jgi:hypothetical protein
VNSPEVSRQEVPAWVTTALGRVRFPAAPVGQSWDFSASALIAPHLPGVLRRVPGVLDRFGAVRLTRHEIGIDATRPVPWKDVVELHTRPLFDVVAVAASDNLSKQAARLIPPIPIAGRLARSAVSTVADKAADAVLSILLLALGGHADRAGSIQVPIEIVYRARWRRNKTMTAGFISSAVLCLPEVTASVVATAQQNRVPLIALPSTGRHRNAQEVVDKLREHRRVLTSRLAAAPQPGTDHGMASAE